MKIVRAGSGSEVYCEKCLIPGQNPVVRDTVESLGYLWSAFAINLGLFLALSYGMRGLGRD